MKYIFSLFLLVILFTFSLSTVSAADTTVPDPPTNLDADDVSSSKIDLSWNSPENYGNSIITGYKIEYKIIPNNYQTLVSDTGNDDTEYSHTNLQTGKTYVYRIYAINAIGTSEVSGESVATPTSSSAPPEQIPPNPPIQVSASDTSPTQIDISWSKPSENNGPKVTGYTLEKKTSAGEYAILINNTSSTSYSDTDLITDTTYIYRVFALNSVGFSDSSEETTATTTEASAPPVEQIIPNEPRGLETSAISPTEIVLNWFEPKPNEGPSVIGYKIEVKTKAEFATLVANTGTETSYSHDDLEIGKTYTYRIFAINSIGLSDASSESSATPEHTLVPTALVANAVSPTQIDLTWNPPSQTYGQEIVGYEIQKRIAEEYYETIITTGKGITSYSVTDLETDKEYGFVVFAKFTLGSSAISSEATATPTEDSAPPPTETIPSVPSNLVAVASSPTKVDLSWDKPTSDGGTPITGYKIEMKVESGSFITLTKDTESIVTTYTNPFRTPNTQYTYRVYAINSVGISAVSNEASVNTSESALPPSSGTISSPPSGLRAELTDTTQVTLTWDKPFITGGSEISAYKIESKIDSGTFEVLQDDKTDTTFIHTNLDLDTTYTYRISAINAKGTSNPSNIVTVTIEPEINPDPTKRIAGFPDPEVDPQSYVDRYINEPAYKEWFDENFPDYTIYEVVGLPEPPIDPTKIIPGFPDPEVDPQSYVDRYINEPAYKEWFDENFPDYTIYEVVGVDPPSVPKIGVCGEGTMLVDGICTKTPKENMAEGGGCLIATAAFGSELAPQVQFLREVRDNTVMSTGSGIAFMESFNQFYYSFSPTIADLERESPVFKEAVKLFITPMISSLSIMTLAQDGSDTDVLTAGISVIALNLGMYIAAPAIVIYKIRKFI